MSDEGFPVAAELLAEVENALSGDSDASWGAAMAGEDAANEAPAKEEPAAETPAAETKAPEPAAKTAAKAAAKTPAPAKSEVRESALASASIRVNVGVIENLMTLISELVLTRNQLLQTQRMQKSSEFKVPLQRLSHITSDLQEGVTKMRMQPIGNAWSKLPRIVRDLSVDSGKKIELVQQGAETELDRQVLELIKDPLTHMVRNSADHGVEMPEERRAAGKPDHGTVTLEAYHEGGHIVIRISDDGKGLDAEKIKAKAIANNLTTESEAASMTEQQILQFIFRAGFSTAEKVTSVSGRGVGMDVVRTNIERIGGTIEMTSTLGRGTVFMIKIPLTLAIVSALIVETAGERFAIPQINVMELVRASDRNGSRIERVKDSPVFRLRDRLLPLVSLRELLGLKPVDAASAEFIVVTQVGAQTFGIVVDRVYDAEEIVVKPVAPILRGAAFYAGNTILGDGSVIMILDANGIASRVGHGEMEDHAATRATSIAEAHASDSASFLLFRGPGRELKAVPLELVARIEEINIAAMEEVGNRRVVQYRDHLMPLVAYDPTYVWPEIGKQAVLVFSDEGRSMGLVVSEIVDVVQDRMEIELNSDGPGLIGSAVISGKAVDIVDIGHYLTQAYSDWFDLQQTRHAERTRPLRRALVVDDSSFFRNLIAPLLSAANWVVTTAADGNEALKLRDAGQEFDLIVSDIEMPGMNGLEFATEVRADPRWQNTPMIALSAHTSEADIEAGKEAGFAQYIGKSDQASLATNLTQAVATATRREPSEMRRAS
jgi:two-component system chemotaxis sensor kinase CheA